MLRARVPYVAKITIAFLVLVGGAYISLYTYPCRDEIPHFPIFPYAREVRSVVSLDTTEGKLVRFDYQTDADLEAIHTFYDVMLRIQARYCRGVPMCAPVNKPPTA